MKKRIITLLLAISAIVIGGAYAQTKIKVHKGGEVIYSVPLTDVDSVGFAKVTSSVHNGHEFVDLGLPSGTKWATCNVGATAPEEYGNNYAWGETTPQSWLATEYTYNDNPEVLPLSADAANVNWGGNWRMPTYEEIGELEDTNNCTWTWTTQNGVSGYKVTSKKNGNSIFLPGAANSGYYWSSSAYPGSTLYAYCLMFTSVSVNCDSNQRNYGQSVRAVCDIETVIPKTEVAIYKDDEVIYSQPIAEIDSIKFEREYNGISTDKYYRIKNVERDLYLNAANYDFHYTGSFGGVNCVAYAQDADQIFKFELSGDKFKVITNSGYYLYCQQWIVDVQTAGVDLSFVKNDDETYDIMFGESYFAVDELNGYYYPFCNATEGEKATWVLEEATPLPTYTVSVSATEGGTASTSVNSMAQGGSVTLFATPESGYRFVNWTVNGSEVSTENIFVATITANTEFVANFEERTTDTGISLTKEYRIKHVESGNYLNASNNLTHVGGTNGGVNCVAYAENNNQIFVFEASGTNYYLKSKSGYYIYCQQWNVDALTTGTELTFIDNPDGTYYIKNGANYFKVEDVNGVYYPFCDAPADLRATWVLEPVGGEEPEPTPTYTVSVSATQGGTVTTSAESVEQGGSVILTATPETGYRFVNWTLNNNVVSVSNPFIATITANSEFVANFEAEESSGEDNEPIICTVSVGAASTEGSATASATSVEQGGTVILTATPNEGYEFKYWKDLMGDDVLSTDNPYVATVTQNTTFEACFKPKKFTVTVSSTAGGTAQTSSTIVDYDWKVTLTATPDPGYKFIGWQENGVMVGDDSDQVWTLYIYENRKFTAKFEKLLDHVGAHNGYEYVDLGLPSGTKWAICNVGAEKWDDLGGYAAWGETSSKDSYTAENYTYSANPATLPLSADVANVYMGGNWRMPTEEEVQELIDYCTWSQTVSVSNLGVRGHHVTSNINGVSIFIPATGYTQASVLEQKQYITQIWTSSIDSEDNQYAKSMYVYGTGTRKVQSSLRYKGLPFRAVLDSETVSLTVSATEGGVVNSSSRYSTVFKGESITLVATPKSGYNFKNWTLNGTVVSTSRTYTGTVTTNSNFVANFEQTTENGHVYVDLGLSVKWATCNVGATKAEEEGDYFAWGETETKEIYNWETYKWCNGTYNSMTKYCSDSQYGTVDNKTILDIEDDAARANWGGTWRMPTETEIEEMEENCTFTKTTLNGVNGWTITSEINGNSIFVPVNGHYEDGNLKHEEYNFASTWSSSYYNYGTYRATTFRIVSHLGASYEYRCEGYPVRAVCE